MQEPHDAYGIRRWREKPEGATEFLVRGQGSRSEVGMEKLGGRAKTSDVSTRQALGQPHVVLSVHGVMLVQLLWTDLVPATPVDTR